MIYAKTFNVFWKKLLLSGGYKNNLSSNKRKRIQVERTLYIVDVSTLANGVVINKVVL